MSRSKKNKAVALKYNAEEDVAPIVIASGYGELAQRIIDVAEKQGIPVFRDDSAVSLMCMLEVGSNIPPSFIRLSRQSTASCSRPPRRSGMAFRRPDARPWDCLPAVPANRRNKTGRKRTG